MSKKEKERFEICEMFVAKADRDRCFFGIINRFEDHDGNPAVFSKIVMPDDGYICAQATNQKNLGNNLDKICVMILDMGLLNDGVVTETIFNIVFYKYLQS
jgi:hypothetical protein